MKGKQESYVLAPYSFSHTHFELAGHNKDYTQQTAGFKRSINIFFYNDSNL